MSAQPCAHACARCVQVSRDPVTELWSIECSACGTDGAYRERASSNHSGGHPDASLPLSSLADPAAGSDGTAATSAVPAPSPLIVPSTLSQRRNFLDRLQAQLEQAKIGGSPSHKVSIDGGAGADDDTTDDSGDEDDDEDTLSPLAAPDIVGGAYIWL